MTIKLQSLLVDKKAESDGEWIDVKEWSGLDPERPWEVLPTPGLRFCVRSVNDPDYKVDRQKLIEQLQSWKAEGKSDVDIETLQVPLDGALIADRLLLGWEGMDDVYDPVAARALLIRPEAIVLRGMILSAASRCGKRKVEFLKAGEKK